LQARRGRTGLSLQAPADGATAQRPSLQELLGRDDDNYGRAEHRAVLDGLVGALSPREREALRLRFEHDLTHAQIGVRLGISQMQVSRIAATPPAP
jgi:RNA polymerase sigma-B factor